MLLYYLLTLNPILLISLISLIFAYFLYTSIKFRSHLKHPLSPQLFFILQLTADLAVLTGLSLGLVKLPGDSTL